MLLTADLVNLPLKEIQGFLIASNRSNRCEKSEEVEIFKHSKTTQLQAV